MIRELGGYRLVERIGSGGMSTVYRAYDAGGNSVALKLLHPALAEDPSSRDRLRREVRMMQRVRGPYVAQILDAETDQNEVFLVTELIEGPTLAADVNTSGIYLGEDLARLGEELAEALQSIHRVGVLHRDLKPSNVMMDENGPVLIDFGIAQLGDDLRITRQGYVTHTPGYCDPRVLRGQAPDEDADWWAMVAVLAFAATGRPPFGSGAPAIVMNRVLHGQPDLAGLPERLQTAFARALGEPADLDAPEDSDLPTAAVQTAQLGGRANYEALLAEIFAVAAQDDESTGVAEETNAAAGAADADATWNYANLPTAPGAATAAYSQVSGYTSDAEVYETAPYDPTELAELSDSELSLESDLDTVSYASAATQVVEEATQTLPASPEFLPHSYPVPQPPEYPTSEYPASGYSTPEYPESEYPAPTLSYPAPAPAYSTAVPGYPNSESNQLTGTAPETDVPLPYWLKPSRKFRILRLLLGLVIAAVGTIQPAIAAGIAVALALITQIVGETDAALRKRRLRKGGPSSNDTARMVLRLPWSLLKSLGWVVLATVAALALGYLAGALANAMLPDFTPAITGIAVAAGILALWIVLPRGRTGADLILNELAPSRGYRLFWALLSVIVIFGILVMVREIGIVNLQPLNSWPWGTAAP